MLRPQIVAKSLKPKRPANNPIEPGRRDLQQRGGGADIASCKVNCSCRFLDIERQRERPFVEGVEREGLELARIMLTQLKDGRRRDGHEGILDEILSDPAPRPVSPEV